MESFEQYMENQLPNYSLIIHKSILIEMKALYGRYIQYMNKSNELFEMAFKDKIGMDYSNDINMNRECAFECLSEINNVISIIKQQMTNANSKEQSSRRI